MSIWHGMDISDRYDEIDHSGDGVKVGSFKRDIGNNSYSFVYVKTGGHPALITVSKIVHERVKSVQFTKEWWLPRLEGDFGHHLREACPDKGICRLHAIT